MNEITEGVTGPVGEIREGDEKTALSARLAGAAACARCGGVLRLRIDGQGADEACATEIEAARCCPALERSAAALRRAVSGRTIARLRAAARAWRIVSPCAFENGDDRECRERPWSLLRSLVLRDARDDEEERFWREISLRLATGGDIPRLVDLVESAYRGQRSRQGWTTEADLLDGQRTDAAMLAELLAGPDSRILLIERGMQALACAHLAREGECAWFGLFAVSPPRQRYGLGGVLLEAAELFARDRWGCRWLKMKVISLRRELIAWYSRRGYAPTGERAPFPYGDERFGRPRREDLEFVVLARELGSGSSA